MANMTVQPPTAIVEAIPHANQRLDSKPHVHHTMKAHTTAAESRANHDTLDQDDD